MGQIKWQHKIKHIVSPKGNKIFIKQIENILIKPKKMTPQNLSSDDNQHFEKAMESIQAFESNKI